jgi:hypothetical protein
MRRISNHELMTFFVMVLMGTLVGGSIGTIMGAIQRPEGNTSSKFTQWVLMMSLKYSAFGAMTGAGLAILRISWKRFFTSHERETSATIELTELDVEAAERLRLFSESQKSWY